MQRKNLFRHFSTILAIISILYTLTGCTNTANTSGISNVRHYGGVVETKPKETESIEPDYSGTCYGVVTALDTQNLTITIQDIDNNSIRLYTYTGGTDVRDKYGDIISMTQINLGDIVIGGYDDGSSKMKKLTKHAEAWENRKVTDFKIDTEAKTIKIGTTLYQFKDNVVVLSDGQRLETLTEISEKDELTLKGCDKTIYSITITKGHGYVTLENAQDYYGGIVTVGNKVGQEVTEDMILVVPEGEYNLHISKDGQGISKSITVVKNEELVIDIGEFKEPAKQIGSIEFLIKPENATLYIDGRNTAFTEVVELPYGSYKIRVEAEGYITYKGDFVVSEDFQKRDITLGKPEEETKAQQSETLETVVVSTAQTTTSNTAATSTASANIPTVQTPTVTAPTVTAPTVSEPGQATTAAEATAPGPGANTGKEVTDYKLHIEAPIGASVYFDGVYKGIVPVSFPKYSGEHTIILKQEGYATKSHTITISDDQADSHYSFPALVPN